MRNPRTLTLLDAVWHYQTMMQPTKSNGQLIPLFLSLIVWIGGAEGIRAQSSDPPSVVIEWAAPHSQDMLSGELVSADERYLTLRSRLFQQPVAIDRKAIQAIQFGLNKNSTTESSASELLVLTDGSRLRGTGSESDPNDTSISFSDELVGKVSVPKSVIVRREKLRNTLYEWDGIGREWKDRNENEKPQWEVNKKGHYVGNKQSSGVWLPVEHRGSFAVNLHLSGTSKPAFQMAFGKDPEKSLRIAMVGDSLILGTSTDFEVIRDLPTNSWSVHLRLEWDASDKTWTAREIKASLENVDGNSSSPPIVAKSKGEDQLTGILLLNENGNTHLEAFTLFGSAEAGRDGTSTAVAVSESVRSESEFDRLRGWNGTLLHGKMNRLQNGLIEWLVPTLGGTKVAIPVSQISKMEWKSDGVVGQPEYELSLGPNKLRGALAFGEKDQPLRWKSLGQQDFVGLQTDFPFTIRRKTPAHKVLLGTYTDLVYAKNGDVIPVSVGKLDGTKAELLTPFTKKPKSVPCAQLLALELDREGKRLKHTFTKESRDQLLSIPRGSDLSLYPHALIGDNGDLLRGVIQSVTSSTIEMEVKMEPSLIGRDSVAAIVFLHEAEVPQSQDGAKAKEDAKDSAIEESLRERLLETGQKSARGEGDRSIPWVRLLLKDDFQITVQINHEDEKSIECYSEWLGECSIPKEYVDWVAGMNVDLGATIPYVSWETKSLATPTWNETDTPNQEGQSLVGTVMESFELAALSGTTFRSSEHAGKVLVLDFWATWCGPCVKLLPEYMEIIQGYSETEVVFVGVNASESPEVVREFASKQKLARFESLFDYDNSLSSRFLVSGIPHTVVVGPNGVIEYVHVGYTKTAAEKLKATIDKLLEKK